MVTRHKLTVILVIVCLLLLIFIILPLISDYVRNNKIAYAKRAVLSATTVSEQGKAFHAVKKSIQNHWWDWRDWWNWSRHNYGVRSFDVNGHVLDIFEPSTATKEVYKIEIIWRNGESMDYENSVTVRLLDPWYITYLLRS